MKLCMGVYHSLPQKAALADRKIVVMINPEDDDDGDGDEGCQIMWAGALK